MSDRAEVPSKNLQDIISELTDLTGQRKEVVAGAVACIMDNRMCLHCSRSYLLPYLSDKDRIAYDQVFHPEHWCKCED